MNRRRLVGLALLSLATGGCAAVRLPDWVPFPRARVETPDPPLKPEEPRREPATGGPPRATPPDAEKLEALYRVAKVHLIERRDDEAYRALTQITRVSPQYKDCATLLRDVRTRLVRQRYQEGLRLFRDEKIEEAIGEWRVVLEMDPTQANARRNIEQAEQILRTLDEHRKR